MFLLGQLLSFLSGKGKNRLHILDGDPDPAVHQEKYFCAILCLLEIGVLERRREREYSPASLPRRRKQASPPDVILVTWVFSMASGRDLIKVVH
jgi:hypothetical protein